nr:spermidine synthase [Verrucomicrobiota bacterium]
ASGDTAYALGGRAETESITCLEIVRPQLLALKKLNGRFDYGALHGLLSDGRFRFPYADGRAYLMRTEQQFDVIEADALRPGSAYANNLYSLEYFQLLKSKLRPGGLAVSWAPTDRVKSAFVQAFPYAIWLNGIMLGSNTPIIVDPEAIAARLKDPFTVHHYARGGVDFAPFFTNLLVGGYRTYTPESLRAVLTQENRDLAPLDEYLVPMR